MPAQSRVDRCRRQRVALAAARFSPRSESSRTGIGADSGHRIGWVVMRLMDHFGVMPRVPALSVARAGARLGLGDRGGCRSQRRVETAKHELRGVGRQRGVLRGEAQRRLELGCDRRGCPVRRGTRGGGCDQLMVARARSLAKPGSANSIRSLGSHVPLVVRPEVANRRSPINEKGSRK